MGYTYSIFDSMCIIVLYIQYILHVFYLIYFIYLRLVLNSILNPNLPVGEGVFDPQAGLEDQV